MEGLFTIGIGALVIFLGPRLLKATARAFGEAIAGADHVEKLDPVLTAVAYGIGVLLIIGGIAVLLGVG
jgi:hypothetical protein